MEQLMTLWNAGIQKKFNEIRLRLVTNGQGEEAKKLANIRITSFKKNYMEVFNGESLVLLSREDFSYRELFPLAYEQDFLLYFPHFFLQADKCQEEEFLPKLLALSAYKSVSLLDIMPNNASVFDVENTFYYVFHASERFEQLKKYVVSDLMYECFSLPMLTALTHYPAEFFRSISKNHMGEFCAEFDAEQLLSVIETTCGIDAFCHELIRLEGYARWFSPAIEIEEKTGDYYIYPYV